MKIEITKKKETPLLSRMRVTGFVTYTGPTPSRLDIRKELAKQLKVDERLVIIKHVYSRFGLQKSKVIANIYGNERQMSKLEHSSLLAKHKPGEKPKKEKEEKVEEAKEEAKKEEKAKEEAKEEKAGEKAEEKKEKEEGTKKEEVKKEKQEQKKKK